MKASKGECEPATDPVTDVVKCAVPSGINLIFSIRKKKKIVFNLFWITSNNPV